MQLNRFPALSIATAIAIAIAVALGLSACSSSEPPAPVQAKSPAAATSEAKQPDAGSAAVTGVPACDDFLASYERCLADKVPAQASAQMQAGMAQWKQSWREMAANAATRDALPQICQQSRDASLAALQAYGCEL